MFFQQILQAQYCITLIFTTESTTITDKVLSGRYNLIRVIAQLLKRTLHTENNLTTIGTYNRRFVTVTFIGASPAVIFDDGYGWRKNPIDTRGGDFTCGDSTNLSQQGRVIRSA